MQIPFLSHSKVADMLWNQASPRCAAVSLGGFSPLVSMSSWVKRDRNEYTPPHPHPHPQLLRMWTKGLSKRSLQQPRSAFTHTINTWAGSLAWSLGLEGVLCWGGTSGYKWEGGEHMKTGRGTSRND